MGFVFYDALGSYLIIRTSTFHALVAKLDNALIGYDKAINVDWVSNILIWSLTAVRISL